MIYDYEANMLFEVSFRGHPDFSAFVKTAVTHEEDGTIELFMHRNSWVSTPMKALPFFEFEEKILDKKEIETINAYQTVSLKEYDRDGTVVKEKEYKVKEIIFI